MRLENSECKLCFLKLLHALQAASVTVRSIIMTRWCCHTFSSSWGFTSNLSPSGLIYKSSSYQQLNMYQQLYLLHGYVHMLQHDRFCSAFACMWYLCDIELLLCWLSSSHSSAQHRLSAGAWTAATCIRPVCLIQSEPKWRKQPPFKIDHCAPDHV